MGNRVDRGRSRRAVVLGVIVAGIHTIVGVL